MSKITRTEGMVLLILALGTVCFLDGLATRGSGADNSLISVVINGTDVSHDPPCTIVERLRATISVNVTWTMLYNPDYQLGWMQIALYNNASKIQASIQFTDRGINRNRVWVFSLLPEEWTLANKMEYGRVEVTLEKFDGIQTFTNTTRYPIQVLPEQVNVSLVSYSFNNDTLGRMDFLNASYHVQSVQDPSFHHPNLQFSCQILNATRSIVFASEFSVNEFGSLDVIIGKGPLISLEAQSMVIKNVFTTRMEPVVIETSMDLIVNRTDFLLYYRNMTENLMSTGVSVTLNFETGTLIPGLEAISPPLYYEWSVVNGSGYIFQQGSGSEAICRSMAIRLDASLTPFMEQLSVVLWFEGNFIFKSKQVSLRLQDQLLRSEMEMELVNHAYLLARGMGNLSILVKDGQAGTPIPLHPVDVWTLIDSVEDPQSSFSCLTDENGLLSIPLSDAAILGLEKVRIIVTAHANIGFKEYTKIFQLNSLFPRVQPSLRLNNNTGSLVLHVHQKNQLSMSILVDGNVSLFSGRSASVKFLDERALVLQEVTVIVGIDGQFACILPVDLFDAGQKVWMHVRIGATLVNQELSESVMLRAVAVIDSALEASKMALNASIIIIVAMFGVIVAGMYVKRKRYTFLSKHKFTIKLA